MTLTEDNLDSEQQQEVSLHERTDASKQISQTESSKGFIPSGSALFFLDNLGRQCMLVCKIFGLLMACFSSVGSAC